MRALAIAIFSTLLFDLARLVTAYPNGAGACVTGRTSVASSHLFKQDITSGNLAAGSYDVTFDGTTNVSELTDYITTTGEVSVEVKGPSFRGLLLVMENTTPDQVTSQTPGTKPATICSGLGGITHDSDDDKESFTVEISLDTPGTYPVDINIVVENSGSKSTYYYGSVNVVYQQTQPEPCVLDENIEVTCYISKGPQLGQNCLAAISDDSPQVCTTRPSSLVMRYTGGGCSQSSNGQGFAFSCDDGPGVESTSSYIIATDIKGQGITFHRDFVQVGEYFEIVSPDGADRIETSIQITAYASTDTSTSNELQVIRFDSSCSGSLSLKDKFGGFQLAAFENSVQGFVSFLTSASIFHKIELPSDFEDSSVSIDSLLADISTASGSTDLLSDISSETVSKGGSVSASKTFFVDLNDEGEVLYSLQLQGSASPSGRTCTGSSSVILFDGQMNPPTGNLTTSPVSPTPAPSSLPTSTPTTSPVSPTPVPSSLPTSAPSTPVTSPVTTPLPTLYPPKKEPFEDSKEDKKLFVDDERGNLARRSLRRNVRGR